ncbi:membrane protein [Streptomyces phage Faust]|uniref:Membrane protein n=1 Tax=Streptomyces phage Faust TaxID=2767565 RepID=A0A7G9UZ75_9CAUD|nr:membrane protein [Streptomyces phage Faust]QNN99330.1 membrane protein [Streptomyces phage Faust]
MDKARAYRVREFLKLFFGSIAILAFMFVMMFAILALDDSQNKCASKIASKVYDPECF